MKSWGTWVLPLMLSLCSFSAVAAEEEAQPGAGEVPLVHVRERETWFRNAWVVRLNGGYSTDENLGSITGGKVRVDNTYSGLIGLSVGRPIVDDFRDWPVDFIWKAQLIRYFERGDRDDFWGGTISIKAYWKKFPWDRYVRTRVGFAEGVSYVEHVPSIEKEHLKSKDRNTSRLLNYLDVSVDVNARDVTRVKKMESCWLGFAISHRSGVFESVDIFGEVKGGSNYNTGYLECQF